MRRPRQISLDFTRNARTYEQQKRFDEAAATLRELVAVENKAGDRFHMEIANRDLARVLLLGGHIDEYRKLSEISVDKTRAEYGPNSLHVAYEYDKLAQDTQKADPKLAWSYTARADQIFADLRKAKVLEAHCRSQRKAALQLIEKKNFRAAEDTLRKALATARLAGIWSCELPCALMELGAVEEALGKNADAVPLYKEAMDLLTTKKYSFTEYSITKNSSRSSSGGFQPADHFEAMALYLRALKKTGRGGEAQAFWKARMRKRELAMAESAKDGRGGGASFSVFLADKNGKPLPAKAGTIVFGSGMRLDAQGHALPPPFPLPKRDIAQMARDDLSAIDAFKDTDSRNGVKAAP